MTAGLPVSTLNGTGPAFPTFGGKSRAALWSDDTYYYPVKSRYGGVSGYLLTVGSNGQWGSVCGTGFTGSDAMVACRELGWTSGDAGTYLDDSSVTGIPRPAMADVSCVGNESSIWDCKHSSTAGGKCNAGYAQVLCNTTAVGE